MNPLHRCSLRFHRTASAAFRDHTYGAAVEKPAPKGYGALWWLAFVAVSVLAVVVIVRGAA